MLTKWEFCRATGKIYEFEKDVILDNLLDQILVDPTKGETCPPLVSEQHCHCNATSGINVENEKIIRIVLFKLGQCTLLRSQL